MDSQATLSAAIPDENIVGIGARIDQDEIAYDHFHGEIDEIRIWDIALSQDQIRFIMNQEIEKISNLIDLGPIFIEVNHYRLAPVASFRGM